MAGLIGLTRKTETIQGYQLTSSSDMMAALNYITQAQNYTGTVTCGRPAGTLIWQLTIYDNTASGSAQSGGIGDWVIIENNSVASICTNANFASLYQAA